MNARMQAHNAILAVAPIHGISFGIFEDKNTWKIHFSDAATDDQKAQALAIVTTFQPSEEIAQEGIVATVEIADLQAQLAAQAVQVANLTALLQGLADEAAKT